MRLMIDIFVDPLESSGIISVNESYNLFANIKQLIAVNEGIIHNYI